MDLAELAQANGLRRVGARPPLGKYLAETWRRRDFIYTMAKFRLRASLESGRLGVVWLLVRPCLDAAIYGAIFGVLQGPSIGPDYVARVTIGVFLFQFFTKSLSDGSKSITGNRALVQSLAFPRLTLPLAKVVEQGLSTLPSIALLVVVILPVQGHLPSVTWLLIIPLFVLYTLFNAGIAMIAARLTVHMRDLTQLLPFISRILFYTSGVLFNVETIFKSHPWVVRVYDFHPLYQVLQLARGALMGIECNLMYWVYFGTWSIVLSVGGLAFFWVAEERYGRD